MSAYKYIEDYRIPLLVNCTAVQNIVFPGFSPNNFFIQSVLPYVIDTDDEEEYE